MFIDSKPVSLYSHGSRSSRDSIMMEDPNPRMLRRPPAVLNHSTSSLSLSPLEKSIPSFQSFIKRTPTPNQEKPLPPVPSFRTSESSPISTRRTSSVYSRTVSQYAPTPESWRSEDHLSPKLFLQPSVYSLSTPELTLDGPSETSPPRPYAPLIASPSPSPSRKSTPSPPPGKRSSGLLPPPPPMLRIATQHIRTVSLDKAKAALRSSGVQPLLPEEMRALAAAKKAKEQVIRTSRSFEVIVPARSPTLSPELSPNPRLPSSTPYDWPLQADRYSSDGSKLSDEYFGTNRHTRLSLSPVERQLKSPIQISVTRPEEPSPSDYEPCGRARVKSETGSSKRINDYESENPDSIKGKTYEAPSNESLIDEAQRLANEYHALFKEESVKKAGWRKHSASSNSVREAMKLVPQPLFFNPRTVSKQRTLQYQKEQNNSRFSPASRSPSSRDNPRGQRDSPRAKERAMPFPFKLSLTPESTNAQRRRSTSGSIPISPPFAPNPDRCPQTPDLKLSEPYSGAQRKNSIDDSNRFSAFYKRINADAEQLAREYNRPGNKIMLELNTLPTIFSSASDENKDTSSIRKASQDSKLSAASSAKTSNNESPLKKGLGAMTTAFHQHVRKSSVTAAEGIAGLVDTLKTRRPSFPVISAPQPLSSPMPQRSKIEVVALKRPSLFQGIREHRRESRASRRRQELKNSIKMVPSGVVAEGSGGKEGEWL